MIVEIHVSDIRIGHRSRHDIGDMNDLVTSIREVGLLTPITVSATHQLVDGYRRLEACRRLGIARIKAVVVPVADGVHAGCCGE